MEFVPLLLVFMFSKYVSVNSGLGTNNPQVCPKIITKNEWGARGATQVQYSTNNLQYVIIHHTATPECNNLLECSILLKNIQNYHMEVHQFHDIGYNFMIGGDGKVYEGRGWHKIGAHTRNFNSRSLGIAFVGKYIDKLPNKSQLRVTRDLIHCAVLLKEIDESYKLYGARQVSGTLSPGLRLYQELQTWPHFSKRL
ncbi:hypothetical protein FQA39_LY02582 [Lamprigera yunnana]|nr:hypothetical protein FQA39_LY02582 [Lamprigera yunnana]